MAIVQSVNWISGEITISRAGMTLLQASPEIRGLDVNALRLELRDLEDDVDGRPWPATHVHTTEETLSGVVYARKFSIIDPYFITFEDGIYSVIADNSANHNLLDVRTYNSVSLSVSNSAGLQIVAGGGGSSAEILAIHGQVTRSIFVDTELVSNGNGYQQTPYNNWSDAVDDAEANGIKSLVLLADATIDRLLKNFIIVGGGNPVVDLNGQNVDKCEFRNLSMTGQMAGKVTVDRCELNGVTGMDGQFKDCGLSGTLEVAPGGVVVLENPHSDVAGLSRPTFSMNLASTGAKLSLRGYSGGFTLTNCNHANDEVTLEISQGKVTLDASCTAGTVSVRGLAQFTDDSTGTAVDKSALLQPSKLLTLAKFLGLH